MTSGADPAAAGRRASGVDVALLKELATRLPFWRGMTIGRQGESCNSLYVIVEGQVILARKDPDGENHALYLLGPGEAFGEGSFHPDSRWMVTARAVTDGVAYALPSAQLPRLAQYYPQLVGGVLSLLSRRLERSHQRLDLLASTSARERLLGLLRLLAQRHAEPHGDELWLPVRLTQTELGDMVGLARETVGRAIASLEDEGVIRRRTRRGIWLRLAALGMNGMATLVTAESACGLTLLAAAAGV